jgi:hypothetical protein
MGLYGYGRSAGHRQAKGPDVCPPEQAYFKAFCLAQNGRSIRAGTQSASFAEGEKFLAASMMLRHDAFRESLSCCPRDG